MTCPHCGGRGVTNYDDPTAISRYCRCHPFHRDDGRIDNIGADAARELLARKLAEARESELYIWNTRKPR